MNTNDLELLYYELLQTLNNLGLSWLVNRINEQIAEGKPVIKEDVPTFKESKDRFNGLQNGNYIQSGKSTFISVEEYSITDRMDLLADAIQVAVDVVLMQNELAAFFQDQEEDLAEAQILIIDETNQEPLQSTIKISRSSSDMVGSLLQILERLRMEINNVKPRS